MKWHNIPDDIVTAISAGITGTANRSQSDILNRWLDADEGNRAQYKELCDSAALGGRLAEYGSYRTAEALGIIKSKIAAKRRRRTLLKRIAVAASCAAAVLAAVLFLPVGGGPHSGQQAVVGWMNEPADISLVSGGQTMAISRNAAIVVEGETAIISGTGGQEAQQVDISGQSWHKLIVPRGRRSDIVLPDGSRVWLNAGTVLEFPSRFSGFERRIRVSGEVFVDASNDPSKPFFVETGDMTVRVLGTSFNVSSYPGDGVSSVVLVEGSVEVDALDSRYAVSPGQMLSLRGGAAVLDRVNVEPYVSWKDGYMSFEGKVPVLSVLEKIERYYDVTFSREDSEMLAGHTCSGKLILFDDVDEVLETLCLISGTEYERDGNTVYIRVR